jgi:hypothetical protein
MSALGIGLWLLGVAFFAIGYSRVRRPWARLQELKAQDANIARYEAWRGGIHSDGPTGASVAMDVLRRQVRDAGIVIAVGFVLVVLGFLVPA